jgi:thioredoxin reductase (NADPH)
MPQPDRWDMVIVGAGIAGLSAAIWGRRLGLSTLVLDGAANPGGQLQRIPFPIPDYPALNGIMGPELADRLFKHAQQVGAAIRLGQSVEHLDLTKLEAQTAVDRFSARALVIATGIAPRRLDVPGEEAVQRAGLIRRPSYEPEWFKGKRVAVIGGGDRAVENALALSSIAARVTLIHRGQQLRALGKFQKALAAAPRVELLLERRVERFALTGSSAVLYLTPEPLLPSLEVDAVCVYIGSEVPTASFGGQLVTTEVGLIQVDREGQTSSPGVFAIGDGCTPSRNQSLSSAAGQAMWVAKRVALSLRP